MSNFDTSCSVVFDLRISSLGAWRCETCHVILEDTDPTERRLCPCGCHHAAVLGRRRQPNPPTQTAPQPTEQAGDEMSDYRDEDARRREVYFDLQADDNLPAGHTFTTFEDEYTEHCECGKWIETGTWDIWDHINDVLRPGIA